MQIWPIDDKVTSLKEKFIKPSNRKTSDSGYTMSFPRGTILKKSFQIVFSYLSKLEKDTIQNFFDDNQGTVFQLNDQDPNSSDVYSVVFDQDELEFTYVRVFPGEYTVSIEFREV